MMVARRAPGLHHLRTTQWRLRRDLPDRPKRRGVPRQIGHRGPIGRGVAGPVSARVHPERRDRYVLMAYRIC